MTNLVTFDQVKEHLNVDHDADDLKIQEVAVQANAIVRQHMTFLGTYLPEWDEESSSGSPVADVPEGVVAATLLVAGALYENRDGSANGPQPLSPAVLSLLTPNRDPALA